MKTKAIILIITGFIFVSFGLTLKFINSNNSKTVDNENKITDPTLLQTETENQKYFREFIESKFNDKYFTIKTLSVDDNSNANLQIKYNIKGNTGLFYVQTQWIEQTNNEFITITNKEITNYQTYFQNNNTAPFYKIVGINGKPNEPELLYIIPVNKINTNKLLFKKIEQFKKEKIKSNFFFDTKEKILQ